MNVPGDPNFQPESLGKKIEKPPMPEPHRKVREGVYQGPDGKLYTEAPPPPPAP